MSGPDREVLTRLARSLPDIPRWVETRSILLSGHCEVFGLTADEKDFVVRDPEDGGVSIVGRPSEAAILASVARDREDEMVLCAPETRGLVQSVLPGWEFSPVALHLPGDYSTLFDAATETARIVSAPEIDLDALPDDLRPWLEMTLAREAPVAASFSEGRVVSFCCAVSTTETLWDISIDTLPAYRSRGYAARCVSVMARYMLPLRPVWAAEESNLPSIRLAAKLGFVPVDRVPLFHRPS